MESIIVAVCILGHTICLLTFKMLEDRKFVKSLNVPTKSKVYHGTGMFGHFLGTILGGFSFKCLALIF